MKSQFTLDYYSVLGVAPSCKQSEIAKAYKKLAARYHPDKHSDNDLKDLAEEKLRQLNEAYEVLSNSAHRSSYDAERREQEALRSGEHRAHQTLAESFYPFKRLFYIAVIIVAVLFAVRFVHSIKAMLVIGIAITAAWFGPRLIRLLQGRR